MSNLKNHLPIVHLICPAEIISGGVYCLLFFTLTLIQKRQRKKKAWDCLTMHAGPKCRLMNGKSNASRELKKHDKYALTFFAQDVRQVRARRIHLPCRRRLSMEFNGYRVGRDGLRYLVSILDHVLHNCTSWAPTVVFTLRATCHPCNWAVPRTDYMSTTDPEFCHWYGDKKVNGRKSLCFL